MGFSDGSQNQERNFFMIIGAVSIVAFFVGLSGVGPWPTGSEKAMVETSRAINARNAQQSKVNEALAFLERKEKNQW